MVMMQMLLVTEVNYDGHVCALKAPCTQPGVVFMMAKLMLMTMVKVVLMMVMMVMLMRISIHSTLHLALWTC